MALLASVALILAVAGLLALLDDALRERPWRLPEREDRVIRLESWRKNKS